MRRAIELFVKASFQEMEMTTIDDSFINGFVGNSFTNGLKNLRVFLHRRQFLYKWPFLQQYNTSQWCIFPVIPNTGSVVCKSQVFLHDQNFQKRNFFNFYEYQLSAFWTGLTGRPVVLMCNRVKLRNFIEIFYYTE